MAMKMVNSIGGGHSKGLAGLRFNGGSLIERMMS